MSRGRDINGCHYIKRIHLGEDVVGSTTLDRVLSIITLDLEILRNIGTRRTLATIAPVEASLKWYNFIKEIW